MINFFDLPHIFIVFPPGAGGNFIAGLFDNIVSNRLGNIHISKEGASHSVIGGSSITFGTSYDEHNRFTSQEQREQYYIHRIKEDYKNIDTPVVAWTHDFTNISLYKKYFKNSKVFVIKQDTDLERASCIFMNVTKMLVLDSSNWPLHEETRKQTHLQLTIKIYGDLNRTLRPEYKEEIIKNRYDEKYKDLLTFTISKCVLRYFGLLSLFETLDQPEYNVYDQVLYPNKKIDQVWYSVGEDIQKYVNEADAVLPYYYLKTRDFNLLATKIGTALGRELENKELDFLKNSFDKYVQAQNYEILENPVSFYQKLYNKSQKYIL